MFLILFLVRRSIDKIMQHNKYYAIKIGNNVKDIIVTTWEHCKEYVIGYPSIYKSFKSKKEAEKYLKNITNIDIENQLLNNNLQRFIRLKKKIEFEYNFNIPDYIIDELINNNDYNNLCCLINMAVVQKRITKQQGKFIKEKELKKYKNK